MRCPLGLSRSCRQQTAHPTFKEEHVATSSAEAEINSLALFTNEILSLSYAVEEAGFKFSRSCHLRACLHGIEPC